MPRIYASRFMNGAWHVVFHGPQYDAANREVPFMVWHVYTGPRCAECDTPDNLNTAGRCPECAAEAIRHGGD